MVRVVEYDVTWPSRFDHWSRRTVRLSPGRVEVVAIEHVGSTAVPGLAGKPVIDCDIVVTADQVEPASDVLVGLGIRPSGKLDIPERWAFREPPTLSGTNTYVIVEGRCPYATTFDSDMRCEPTQSCVSATPPSSDGSVPRPATSRNTAEARTP